MDRIRRVFRVVMVGRVGTVGTVLAMVGMVGTGLGVEAEVGKDVETAFLGAH